MNIELKFSPFPHIIINDYYDEKQYENIWNEIKLLCPKMIPPEGTRVARDHRGLPKKKGVGIFLEDVYKNSMSFSDIAVSSRLILSPEFRQNIATHSNGPEGLYFKLYDLVHPNTSSTIVQLYMNGDYYKPHLDHSLFTSVIVVHSKEKQYEGGEFHFPEYNYTINIENNQALIFPSRIIHEVKEIKMKSEDPLDGRFSISLLMPMNTFNQQPEN